MFYDYRERVE